MRVDGSNQNLNDLANEIINIFHILNDSNLKNGDRKSDNIYIKKISDKSNDNQNIANNLAIDLIRSRKNRAKYFKSDYFYEPIWDIMLDLFVSKISNRRISISSACIASRVPPTTALRYLSQMKKEGIVENHADRQDKRKVYVELSEKAMESMMTYLLSELGIRS